MQSQTGQNYTRVALAILIAAIVVSAAALSYSSFESTVTKTGATTTSVSTSTVTTTSTEVTTVTSTTTMLSYTPSVCLKEVPQSAVLGQYDNTTSQGFTATYTNGTEAYFPLGTCPVPVTPDNYLIDSTIEANPAFVSAENGSTYEATTACNCHWSVNVSGPSGEWSVLNFVLYSNQRIYPCGPGQLLGLQTIGANPGHHTDQLDRRPRALERFNRSGSGQQLLLLHDFYKHIEQVAFGQNY